MRTEESEKLSLSPRDWRGRSLALLTQLTAWSASPLIHRQGGMNIYKKLRNSVASPSFFLFLTRIQPPPVCTLVSHHLVVADSLGCPLLYFSRFSHFFDVVRLFSGHYEIIRLFIVGADTITGFIAETRNFVIMHNFVLLCILVTP